ncbi:hypothetical protein [Acetobacter sp.]|jgi:hypothetical protein|uniref:hypothetical protein n=1 Tax=Acetobacter sp. TaxID=440 RepID=UPI0025C5BE26|nr:hypothetical protein [Acetobacter sp.]MCH4091548.1 hypothetical protein [Acetobacter sp.]MCI1299526.1 hypothetical protein [Acetobacter sp.]MCI1316884.1 hypothetical protein [Acetobacter sp.]
MTKKQKPMTRADFISICDCVSKTGNSSNCMRLANRPLSDLYYYLKKNPDERQRLTIARTFFHDEMTAAVHDLAFGGIPQIRRTEKGKIVIDERGKPIIDRIPDTRLITTLLRDHSSRLARAEKADLSNSNQHSTEERNTRLRDEIVSDPPPKESNTKNKDHYED